MTILKNKTLNNILLVSIIVALYFFSRFQNLTKIPVFADEGIYIRWAQLIKNVETLRFIPVTDGKQPLYMWTLAAVFKFIKEPLIAGRTISVFAGFGIMICLYFASIFVANFKSNSKDIKDFFIESNKKYNQLGILSMLVYALLPFSFFFDRMALADNMLSFFGILSLTLLFLLAKFPRLDISLILGITLGLAWLTKSPAIYFIALSLGSFVILAKEKKYVFLPIISAIISFVIYNILRLGPQFQMIAIRNRDYVFSLSEVMRHPLDPLVPHLKDITNIYSQYISVPVIIFSLLFVVLFLIQKANLKNKFIHSEYFVLLFWWILPIIANATIAKTFTARYILFTLPPLIILISLGLTSFAKNTCKLFGHCTRQYLLVVFVFSLNIFWMYHISTNPQKIKLPPTESGYLVDWTSGWGIKESAEYCIERSKTANVIVGTEGYFGTLPDGFQIYVDKVPHITVVGVGLGFKTIPENLLDAKKFGDEVYLIANKSRLKLLDDEYKKIEIIKQFSKPDGDSLLLIKI